MLPRSGWIPRRCTRGFAKQAAAPRTLEALEAELRATRAELERTRLQRDILKKTLGIVCEPSPNATPGSTR